MTNSDTTPPPYRTLAKELDENATSLGLVADHLTTLDELDMRSLEAEVAINSNNYALMIADCPQYEERGGSYNKWLKIQRMQWKVKELAQYNQFRRSLVRKHASKISV